MSTVETDATLEALLDIAADEVAQHGMRRMSINDIAERAELSRPTVYRRLGGKDELLQLLLARVATAFWADQQTAISNLPSVAERAGESLLAGLRTARAHPMVARLLNENPHQVLRVWATSKNPQLLTIRDVIGNSIDPDHTLTCNQAARAADLLQRIGMSFLTTPSEILDDDAIRRLATAAIAAAITDDRT